MKFVAIVCLLSLIACTKNVKPTQEITALHDIWLVEKMGGKMLSKSEKRPQLEIFVQERRIGGTDGCNSIGGKITEIDQKKLTFGDIFSTRMACPDMTIANQFNALISQVRSYQLKTRNLLLFDEKGNEIMQLLKVD